MARGQGASRAGKTEGGLATHPGRVVARQPSTAPYPAPE